MSAPTSPWKILKSNKNRVGKVWHVHNIENCTESKSNTTKYNRLDDRHMFRSNEGVYISYDPNYIKFKIGTT